MLSNVNDEDRYAAEIPEGSTLDDVLKNNSVEFGEIYRKIRNIHSPEFRDEKIKNFEELREDRRINKYTDWMIISKYILKRRDYFFNIE